MNRDCARAELALRALHQTDDVIAQLLTQLDTLTRTNTDLLIEIDRLRTRLAHTLDPKFDIEGRSNG